MTEAEMTFLLFQYVFPVAFLVVVAVIILLLHWSRGPGFTLIGLKIHKKKIPVFAGWPDGSFDLISVKREGKLFRWRNHYLLPPEEVAGNPVSSLNARFLWRGLHRSFFYLNVGNATLFTPAILRTLRQMWTVKKPKLTEEEQAAKDALDAAGMTPDKVRPGTRLHYVKFDRPPEMIELVADLYPQTDIDEVEFQARQSERDQMQFNWGKMALPIGLILGFGLLLILLWPIMAQWIARYSGGA